MFFGETFTYHTDLTSAQVRSRLADAEVSSEGSETSMTTWNLFGDIYVRRSRYLPSLLGSGSNRAVAWARLFLKPSDDGLTNLAVDFKGPWLARIMFFFIRLNPLSQRQLPEDQQAIVEWVQSILDLNVSSAIPGQTAVVPRSKNPPQPRGQIEGLDVSAAMEKDYAPGFWKKVALGALGMGVLYLLHVGVHPLVLPFLARGIKPSFEEQWGYAILKGTPDLVEDPQFEKSLNEIARKLLATVPRQPYHFTFHVQRSRYINAYATPGGQVVVLSGLISSVRGPDELAAVLAHEIEHVLQRHSLQHLANDRLTHAESRLIYRHTAISPGMLESFLSLRFSRHEEAEADQKGLAMLYAAGINPEGMVSFFERIAKLPTDSEGPGLEMASTHPSDEHRIAEMRKQIAALPNRSYQAMTMDWKAFKRRGDEETAKAQSIANNPAH